MPKNGLLSLLQFKVIMHVFSFVILGSQGWEKTEEVGQEKLGLVRRGWFWSWGGWVWSGEVGSGQERLGLVRGGWVWSGEVGSGQERLGLVRRGWVWSGEVGSGQERLGLVRRGWVWSGEVGSGQERLGLVRRGWVWSIHSSYKLTCLQIAQRERERELLLQHLLQYEQEAWELQSEMNNAHSEKHKLLKKQQGQYFLSWAKHGAQQGVLVGEKGGLHVGV